MGKLPDIGKRLVWQLSHMVVWNLVAWINPLLWFYQPYYLDAQSQKTLMIILWLCVWTTGNNDIPRSVPAFTERFVSKTFVDSVIYAADVLQTSSTLKTFHALLAASLPEITVTPLTPLFLSATEYRDTKYHNQHLDRSPYSINVLKVNTWFLSDSLSRHQTSPTSNTQLCSLHLRAFQGVSL